MSLSNGAQLRDARRAGSRAWMVSCLMVTMVSLWVQISWSKNSPDPAEYTLSQPEPMKGDKSVWPAEWSYFPDGDELHEISWSPQGDRIALVRQAHWPDGGAAHNYSGWALRMLRRKAQILPRFADPRIIIVKPGSEEAVEVDFGWSPRFSPNGRRVAYARQEKPISGMRRMVASTGAGNPIVVFDLGTKKKTVWATPEPKHQFLSPRWIDDETLLVRDCYATNGQLMGCPDLVRISRDGVQAHVRTRPGRKRQRSDPTALFEWTDSAEGLALLQIGARGIGSVATIKSVSHDLFLVSGTSDSPVRGGAKRALFVSGGRWHTVDTRSGRIKRRGRSPFTSDGLTPTIFASPSGRWILHSTSADVLGDGVYLTRSLAKKTTRIWSGPGVLMRAQWTPDEAKLAWVMSRRGSGDPDTRIAGDELLVYDFPRRPNRREVPPYKWQSDWMTH